MKIILTWLMLLSLILPLPVQAAEAPTEIYTPEDLAAMANDPEGSYILMNDLDMSGISWQSIDFRGTLDGNGYAILNLSPTAPGPEHPVCYDGNLRQYEPEYYGLFATVTDATVKNLNLLNVRTLVESDSPCCLAGIAGYSSNSTFTGCTVTGTLELHAHEKLFGIAGIVGYGNGIVEDCHVDVTLICVDTDDTTRDEQFLGGIYGHGYFPVKNCTISIDGYVSEHGYCHNGGIGGMHMRYPLTHRDICEFTGNTVTGKITFFEHNLDRRAYCDAYIGEYLEFMYRETENTKEFLRDERWQYDKVLRPCMCEASAYTPDITAADCRNFGYTTYTCQGCGHSYRDAYTPKVHIPGTWQVTKEPTSREQGEQSASCVSCDYLFTEVLETLPPETTAATLPTAETAPETIPAQDPASPNGGYIWILPAAGVALAIAVFVCHRSAAKRNKGKFQK